MCNCINNYKDCNKNKKACAYNLNISIAYHRTQKENLKNILKNGLLANPYVYLSTQKNDWDGEILFEVNIKGLQLSVLENWQLCSTNNIKPNRLKLLTTLQSNHKQ